MNLKKLQNLEWVQYYAFVNEKVGIAYTAFHSPGAAGITSHHYKRRGKPISISYWVFGRRATSLGEALRLYNERQRKDRANNKAAAGS